MLPYCKKSTACRTDHVGAAFDHGRDARVGLRELRAVPFLCDFSCYTRFLLAIPLLLLSESILGPRIAEAAAHFIASGVIQEKNFQRFDQIVELGLRSRDSVIAEVVIYVRQLRD